MYDVVIRSAPDAIIFSVYDKSIMTTNRFVNLILDPTCFNYFIELFFNCFKSIVVVSLISIEEHSNKDSHLYPSTRMDIRLSDVLIILTFQ